MKNVGAAAFIVDGEGRVLLVKHTYGRLNWELPGGGGAALSGPRRDQRVRFLAIGRLAASDERLDRAAYPGRCGRQQVRVTDHHRIPRLAGIAPVHLVCQWNNSRRACAKSSWPRSSGWLMLLQSRVG